MKKQALFPNDSGEGLYPGSFRPSFRESSDDPDILRVDLGPQGDFLSGSLTPADVDFSHHEHRSALREFQQQALG